VDDRSKSSDDMRDWSADADWRPELTDELKAELDRRLDAVDANPSDVIRWEDIERHVRRTQ
jgi:putative addiction module component (TIGR02574 family)